MCFNPSGQYEWSTWTEWSHLFVYKLFRSWGVDQRVPSDPGVWLNRSLTPPGLGHSEDVTPFRITTNPSAPFGLCLESNASHIIKHNKVLNAVVLFLRLFGNFTRVQRVGARTSSESESERRQRLFSGDRLKIRPLLQSAPIVLCAPDDFTHKPNMHLKVEHIFVYGWGAWHHRAASHPIRKLTGFPPPSKVPVISTQHSFFSYSTVAMVRT